MKGVDLIIMALVVCTNVAQSQTIRPMSGTNSAGPLNAYFDKFRQDYLDTLKNCHITDYNTSPEFAARFLNKEFKGSVCPNAKSVRNLTFDARYGDNQYLQLSIYEIKYPSKQALKRSKKLINPSEYNYFSVEAMTRYEVREHGNYLVFLMSESVLSNIITRYFSEAGR